MNILEKIESVKRREIAEALAREPLDELLARCRDLPPARGFVRALREGPRPALIAEVKKASPSAGVIRGEFDPVAIAQAYERAGANCLSVLTDQEFFQGSDEYLREVRAAVGLPILRKDFTLHPIQVLTARLIGADAILLIVRMLPPELYRELAGTAREHGLDVLVEVHNEEETRFAVQEGADLIGVNNRDLDTFTTDLATTEKLLPLIPAATTRVSESALYTREDVIRVREAGADAVLIGTAFCGSTDIDAKVREVMPWPCG